MLSIFLGHPHLLHHLQSFPGISDKLSNRFTGIFMVCHSGEELGWNGDDMSSSKSGFLNIYHPSNATHDDFAFILPVFKAIDGFID